MSRLESQLAARIGRPAERQAANARKLAARQSELRSDGKLKHAPQRPRCCMRRRDYTSSRTAKNFMHSNTWARGRKLGLVLQAEARSLTVAPPLESSHPRGPRRFSCTVIYGARA